MAISVHSPYAFNTDLVTFTEAAELFAECGPQYQVDPRTLRRWAVKHGLKVEKVGRDKLASWSDLLEVHRTEIDRREARGR